MNQRNVIAVLLTVGVSKGKVTPVIDHSLHPQLQPMGRGLGHGTGKHTPPRQDAVPPAGEDRDRGCHPAGAQPPHCKSTSRPRPTRTLTQGSSGQLSAPNPLRAGTLRTGAPHHSAGSLATATCPSWCPGLPRCGPRAASCGHSLQDRGWDEVVEWPRRQKRLELALEGLGTVAGVEYSPDSERCPGSLRVSPWQTAVKNLARGQSL